jgi:uncharacterized protein (DUF2267 family)
MGTSMDVTEFLEFVEREADLAPPDAERAVQATLETLGERISGGESDDLAAELPEPLRHLVRSQGNAEALDVDEFLRRVAERERTDVASAKRHVRAVFAALGRTVSVAELSDMASELPKDFEPLLAAAQPPPAEQPDRPPPMTADEFVDRVGRRAGLDRDAARRAAEAVLEALADRITGGQVDDLAAQLPEALHRPLQRGKEQSNAAARPLSLDEFVGGIAEREGVPPAQAFEHARAVFATLREAVSEKEFSDTVAQLPDDYRALLARPE